MISKIITKIKNIKSLILDKLDAIIRRNNEINYRLSEINEKLDIINFNSTFNSHDITELNFEENKPREENKPIKSSNSINTKVKVKNNLLSVVIGSYNRKALLEKTIQSVRFNQIRIPYEIIVIDGGSTDGSLQWLIEQKDIITIVQHNRGEFQGKPITRRSWGYFMNLGFKATQGKYILMISDDCLLLPNAVNCGLNKFSEMEKASRKIGGVAFYFRNWPDEKEYYVQCTLGGKLFVNHGIYLREALEAVGWADEKRYMFYKADGDLGLKMWQLGYETVDCPDAYVEHYYDSQEAVRQTNNAILDHDRAAYLKRWSGIYYHADKLDLRTKLTKLYDDPSRTAERFLDVQSTYKKLVENNNISRDVWSWLRHKYSIKTVIDIGANNGTFAEFLAGCFDADETYVFEPLKLYLTELQNRSRKIANLKIFNVALSNQWGSQDFYQNSYGPSSSLFHVSDIHIKEFPHTAEETKIVVDVAPLDEIIEPKSLQQDIFIKIDVQGVEDKVIQGGIKTFSLAKCILIEMSFAYMYDEQPLFEEVHSLLVGLGFRLAGIKNQIVSSQGQPLFAHCFYLR